MTATTHSSTGATANWLIFRIGRVACAVPALSVASILPLPEHITAIPGADAGSPGLFHHGNGTVAIIDLRHRFGCDVLDPQRGRLLLGKVGSGNYAFWVDSIVGLADAAQVRPAALPPELPHNVFSAALRYQNELVLCSDLAPLLAMRDAGGLRHLVCAVPPPPAPAASAPAAAVARPPAPSPAATAAPAATADSRNTPRPLPPPAPQRTPPPPAAAPRPVPARSPAPTVPSRPAVTPSPSAPAAPPPRPVPASAPPATAPRLHTPPPPREATAYTAPPPPASTSRPWPLILALALLAVAIGYLLRPQAEKATPPAPPVARVTPAAAPAPEAEPRPVPPSEPAVAAAPPASPIFQGEGIQVEQNGEEITIVIERARPEAAPEPEPDTAAPHDTTAGPAALPAAQPVGEPAPPEPEPQQMYVHTVVRGDTLWAIAERYLDDPWRYKELAQLSRIKNPDLIYPGNKVRIIIR